MEQKVKIKNCLNCDKEVSQTPGKRQRDYCNDTCRSNHYQKKKRREKKEKVIKITVAKPEDLDGKETSVSHVDEGKKFETNSIQKHPLWKEGDPKENSAAFVYKYGVANYSELRKKKG